MCAFELKDIIACVGYTFEVVVVVLVEGILEVPVGGQRRLRLERLDQFVPFRQIIALCTLSGDACVPFQGDVCWPVFTLCTSRKCFEQEDNSIRNSTPGYSQHCERIHLDITHHHHHSVW